MKQWTIQFGTDGADWTSGVSIDANGNIYVAGSTEGGLDGNINAGHYDIFLIKYDSSGEKQWTRQFGTTSPDGASRVSVDANRNIVYITGYTGGGLDGNINAGLEDVFLVRYDTNGNKQ